MRLVEWEDLEIGVFNCAGELLAIEDRCSHDDGILLDKATEAGDDPFASFTEWTSEADEKAYGKL